MAEKEKIFKLVLEKSGKTEQELNEMIQEKINELSGLISEEGALHIIANELNIKIDIDFAKKDIKFVKINEIDEPNISVSLISKIMKKYDVVNFSNNNVEGKVQSIIIGDETGVIRLAFWNDKVEISETLNEGDIVKFINLYTRENQDKIELSFGSYSELEVNPEGVDVEVKEYKPEVVEKKIEELEENDKNVKVEGIVVDFDIPRYYLGCPKCYKKLTQTSDENLCSVHGEVEPLKIPIVNFVIDDKTGTLSVVAFRENSEKISNLSNEMIFKMTEDIDVYRDYVKSAIGKRIVVVGNINRSNFTDELQLVVTDVLENEVYFEFDENKLKENREEVVKDVDNTEKEVSKDEKLDELKDDIDIELEEIDL